MPIHRGVMAMLRQIGGLRTTIPRWMTMLFAHFGHPVLKTAFAICGRRLPALKQQSEF
jgi:Na+-transporting NADH:ubiquinone oxidoreductase subunit NqrB